MKNLSLPLEQEPNPDARPTRTQITAAVLAMQELIPWFPDSSEGQRLVADEIENFCSTYGSLRWLVREASLAMSRWAGLGELRGLYCGQFRPRDGREKTCRLPGYRPADLERQYGDRQAAETARLIDRYRHERRLLAANQPALIEASDRQRAEIESRLAQQRHELPAEQLPARPVRFLPARSTAETERIRRETTQALRLRQKP